MTKSILLFAMLLVGVVGVARPITALSDAPAVGAMAPDFALTTNEGKQASLKDFR